MADLITYLSVFPRIKFHCILAGKCPVIRHCSGAQRKTESLKLSRYACYLIMQNADPAKEVVTLGQTYLTVQTRLQEIRQMDEYNRLSTEDEITPVTFIHFTVYSRLESILWKNRRVTILLKMKY